MISIRLTEENESRWMTTFDFLKKAIITFLISIEMVLLSHCSYNFVKDDEQKHDFRILMCIELLNV